MRSILIFVDWLKDKVYRLVSLMPLAIYTGSLDTYVGRLYSVHNPGIMKEFHENLISLAFEIGQPNQAICLITFSVVKTTSQAYN